MSHLCSEPEASVPNEERSIRPPIVAVVPKVDHRDDSAPPWTMPTDPAYAPVAHSDFACATNVVVDVLREAATVREAQYRVVA